MTVEPADAADGDDLAEIVDLLGRQALVPDRSDPHGPDGSATDELLEALDEALPRPPTVILVLLALGGLIQLAIVAPWLVGRDPFGLLSDSAAAHLTRDGALGIVVAAAALLTAFRPRWALPSFAMASVALIAQTIAGLFDESVAETSELVHLPSVVLTCLIGLSVIRLGPLGPRRGPRPTG